MKTVKVSPEVLIEHIRQLDKHGLSAELDKIVEGSEQSIIIPANVVEGVKKLAATISDEGKKVLFMRCGAMPCLPWE